MNLKFKRIIRTGIFLHALLLLSFQTDPSIFIARSGQVYFLSDAPLEIISATSMNLTGALNIKERKFSFSIPVNTFEGFNSSLQKIHFNNDYLETDVYPNATFKGKLIEEVDLSIPGEYKIRSKGKLNIHGVYYDRIIRCEVIVTPGIIKVDARFTIFLDEHNIKIPSILNQKIAEEIKVEIKFDLVAQI